jgi:hypothetical protein
VSVVGGHLIGNRLVLVTGTEYHRVEINFTNITSFKIINLYQHTCCMNDSMLRATKRQRLDNPSSWMDCESIGAVISSPLHVEKQGTSDITSNTGILRTPPASDHTTALFYERFEIEILKRFRFSLSSQIQILEDDVPVHTIKRNRMILQQRIRVGINACTRSLEASLRCVNDRQRLEEQPVLLILTSDITPPTIQAQLPVLASQMSPPVPVLLLSGSSSSTELGKLLGTKHVASIVFMSKGCSHDLNIERVDDQLVHSAVDSFVDYIRKKA